MIWNKKKTMLNGCFFLFRRNHVVRHFWLGLEIKYLAASPMQKVDFSQKYIRENKEVFEFVDQFFNKAKWDGMGVF